MKHITITATAESLQQAHDLLEAGVDRIYAGEEQFGLRLPEAFSYEELKELANLVHQENKQLTIAVNALLHQGEMDKLPSLLDFLQEIGTDFITVGDVGVFYVIKKQKHYTFQTIYDASTMVTSSGQINFWNEKAGISEAVLAREIPSAELAMIAKQVKVPVEILVYGASVIHHSKRPLLENYYRFIHTNEEKGRQRDLFLAEPNDPASHYSIFEDRHGTHIFANHDINMMEKLAELVEMGYTHWKLDGVYNPGQSFVEITKQFIHARELMTKGKFCNEQAVLLSEAIHRHHPSNRFLGTGFYEYDPDLVK